MTRRQKYSVVAAVVAAVLFVAGCLTANALAPTRSVSCTINSSNVLSCPLPSSTVTTTKTVPGPTVTAAGPTVTVTQPAPTASTAPSSTAAEPTPTPTSAAPSSSAAPTPTPTAVAPTNLKRVPEDATSGQGWYYDSRGWVTINGNNAVFSGYSVKVSVHIQDATGVVFSGNEVQVSGEGIYAVSLMNAPNATLQANKIHGPSGSNPCDNGIRDNYQSATNVKILDNEIYYCWSGINNFAEGGLIQGNNIHDIGDTDPCGNDPDCGHWNGIQLEPGSGAQAMVIDSNTILVPSPATDAIILSNDGGGVERNRIITNNLLGGGGYTFYGSGGPAAQATGIVFTDNQFTTRYFPRSGSYGPVAHWKTGNGNVWDRNVWADGTSAGQPLSEPVNQ